jgi:hypothetical protein
MLSFSRRLAPVQVLIHSGLIAVGLCGLSIDIVQAQTPPSWTQVGMLTCRLNPSIGFVIFGHQSMECTLAQNALPPQRYEGALNTVGIDLGITAGGVLGWACSHPPGARQQALWPASTSGLPVILAWALVPGSTS